MEEVVNFINKSIIVTIVTVTLGTVYAYPFRECELRSKCPSGLVGTSVEKHCDPLDVILGKCQRDI